MLATAVLFYKKLFVLIIIVGGFFVSPEASSILTHFLLVQVILYILIHRILKNLPLY
jgi:hypothetical protein